MPPRLLLKNLAMPIALAAICAFFAVKEPAFLGSRNLSNLFVEFSIIATLALGMFMVILTGNIDLSVGSGVGLIGGISAVLVVENELSAPLALGLGLVSAVTLWTLMGTLIVKERIPSFIITLGGLLIFKGLFWLIINNSTVPVTRGDETNLYSLLTTYFVPAQIGLIIAAAISAILIWLTYRSRSARIDYKLVVPTHSTTLLRLALTVGAIFGLVLICNQHRGVPLPLVILGATATVVTFLTQHTPFGRYLYAIGGNEEASVLSGIPVNRIIIAAFALLGITTAITGFMTTAYSGNSTTTVGDLMELDAIAACVIGGTALKGGRGTVWGVLFGALIMTTLLNGMTLLAVSPEIKFIARGTVLALAVWMDVRLSRR